jgi:hypothetical protein
MDLVPTDHLAANLVTMDHMDIFLEIQTYRVNDSRIPELVDASLS